MLTSRWRSQIRVAITLERGYSHSIRPCVDLSHVSCGCGILVHNASQSHHAVHTPPPLPPLSFDCNSMPSIPPSACIVGRVECSRTHVGSAAAACCGLGPDRRCRSLMESGSPAARPNGCSTCCSEGEPAPARRRQRCILGCSRQSRSLERRFVSRAISDASPQHLNTQIAGSPRP